MADEAAQDIEALNLRDKDRDDSERRDEVRPTRDSNRAPRSFPPRRFPAPVGVRPEHVTPPNRHTRPRREDGDADGKATRAFLKPFFLAFAFFRDWKRAPRRRFSNAAPRNAV